VAFADIGGWDTTSTKQHRGQIANVLGDFSQSISASGPTSAIWEKTRSWSRCPNSAARRVKTEPRHRHGHANVMCPGRPGKGAKSMGAGRARPSQLFEGRDLAVTTDFGWCSAKSCRST